MTKKLRNLSCPSCRFNPLRHFSPLRISRCFACGYVYVVYDIQFSCFVHAVLFYFYSEIIEPSQMIFNKIRVL